MRITLIIALALFFFPEVQSMSIFDVGKTCVFSSVSVQLLQNGKPVSNAKVLRHWDWNKPKADESVANDDGYVTFPAVFEYSVARLLPIEIVITQRLSVEINGVEKIIWTNSKRKPEENSEYGGAQFDVSCELDDEEVLVEEYGSLMLTICALQK